MRQRGNTNHRRPFIKRFEKSEDGSAAIEFGFVAAPFLYLLMAIFETGLMMFAEYVIENGTAQAARQIRTGQVQGQGVSEADFKTLVCGGMASFLDCGSKLHVDVRKWTAFSDVTATSAVGADGELSTEVTTNSQFTPGGPMEVVTVRVYYDWELFTPLISKLANLAGGRRVLSSSTAFRNEPYEP